jgi:hypothetical protein
MEGDGQLKGDCAAAADFAHGKPCEDERCRVHVLRRERGSTRSHADSVLRGCEDASGPGLRPRERCAATASSVRRVLVTRTAHTASPELVQVADGRRRVSA